MQGMRRFAFDHRTLAAWIIAAALLVKLLLPQGFMLGADQDRHLIVQLCSGILQQQTIAITIPADEKSKDQGQGQGHDKAGLHCPYTSLGMSVTGGADAPLLALAIAFILALGFGPARPGRRIEAPHLRPPLRGPPAVL